MKRSVPRAWLKALISALPQWASANDYLEKDKHYRAYANGADRVHFVIPVWAYGKAYDYYAYKRQFGADNAFTFENDAMIGTHESPFLPEWKPVK